MEHAVARRARPDHQIGKASSSHSTAHRREYRAEKVIPVPAVTATPEPVKPVMQEASASLTSQPIAKIRELSPPPQRKVKKRREQKSIVADAPAVTPTQSVLTARTDLPC
jgi:hypothetical protein